MRIVVFSDSHRDFFALKKAVDAQPGASLFLHLGDHIRDMEDLQDCYPEKAILGVPGNCDFGSDAPAVSYTHLDVYKRQHRPRSHPWDCRNIRLHNPRFQRR